MSQQYQLEQSAMLSTSVTIDIKKAMQKAAAAYSKVYKAKGYNVEQLFDTPEYRELFEQTYQTFDSVISTEVSGAMREYLSHDAFIFSALKTDKQLREARSYLVDESGQIRSFQSFEQKVKKMNVQYNARYLETEYNFAIHSAQAAEQWQEYSDNTDRYHLQYRTAGDEKVRDSHADINGTTLPKTDPFWKEYMPPLGWNCFAPGTKILTAKGWENIEEIKQLNYLIGGSGNVKLVEGIHINTFNGNLITLFSKGFRVSCTPNHRFFTFKGWNTANNIKRGDIIIQVAKVGFFNKVSNAIHNTIILLKYGIMSFVRKR